MNKLFNRVKVRVSGNPGTGTMTLGSAYPGFTTFQGAGAVTGDIVSYVIEEGTSYEVGTGTLTISGDVVTLARTTVRMSSNGGSKISVTSSARVICSQAREDIEQSSTFDSRAEAIATSIPDTVLIISISDGGNILDFIYDSAGTALSTNSGARNWSPLGTISLDHFGGDFALAQAYITALDAKKVLLVPGLSDITVPLLYRNSRSDNWRGDTDFSNQVDPGSQIRYNNTTGKSVTVTSATEVDPAVFTEAAHGLVSDEDVWAFDVSGGTWQAALAGGPWTVVRLTADTFTLKNASGTAFSGAGLGTLSSVTFDTTASIAALHLIGNFQQSFTGIVWRARGEPRHVIKIGADNYLDSGDFSGSITHFFGSHFIPYVDDVTDSVVAVENHKYSTFDHCWFSPGVDYKPVLRIGTAREKSPNTLMTGTASNTSVEQSYVFGDIVLENANNLIITSVQFDATTDPARIRPPTDVDGVAIAVGIYNDSFTNDGGADSALDTAAITQNAADYSSLALLPTSAWEVVRTIIRDWAVGIRILAGWIRVSANTLRAFDANSVGFIIGPRALGDLIDQTNYLLHHARTGAIGIRDDRYKTYTITGITQENPGVVTTSEAHNLADGERVRIIDGGGMTELDNYEFIAQGVTGTTFQLYSTDDAGATSAAVNTTGYTAYSTGGSVKRPYMWHRQSIGGTALSVGHGDMVFDLALDVNTAFTAGAHNLLNMENVPILGGRYEVRYGGVVDMGSVTGVVKFGLLINGVGVAETTHSFDHQGSANTEVPVMFVRTFPMDAIQAASGVTVRFVVTTPTGTVRVRGRRDGSLGQFWCQIRRVA
ncbi:MAG: hypothetical protein WC100_07015 [Sterolibacterium sp.]